jgi:ABC-type branched-subunit amino acid transport system permease subunit
MTTSQPRNPTLVLALASIALTVYMWLFLHAESQAAVGALLALAAIAIALARKTGIAGQIGTAGALRPGQANLWAAGSVLALIALFYDQHFALLMICAVLLYTTAGLGLTLQFGFSGVANFAGAAFFGIGAYATAVLATHTGIPHLLIVVISGAIAAVIGSVLIAPVLRTRGHYAALVTIAFGILFKTFIEVNDVLGGPQGLQVPGMTLFGYALNDGFTVFGHEASFYVSYALLSLVVCGGIFLLVKALERSWVGLAGIAGSVYGMLTGFVAPNNFTFADSLLMLSIVILGGLGNAVGLLPAAVIVLVLPEKLQFIQEYRFLFYAALVIAILLFRPDGLLPRKTRLFFSQEAAR